MSTYEDYVSSVMDLVQAIVDADHAAAESQRGATAMLASFDIEAESAVRSVQARAVELTEEYSSAARQLQKRALQDLGVQLPERVRPLPSPVDSQAAVQAQRVAARALSDVISRYEAALDADGAEAGAAAAALAARRAAMRKPAPAPVPVMPELPTGLEVPADTARRMPPWLPLLIVLAAVPGVIAAWVLGGPVTALLVGAAAGAGAVLVLTQNAGGTSTSDSPPGAEK